MFGNKKILQMHVIKRDGRRELMHFDKITTRLETLVWDFTEEEKASIDLAFVTQKVVQQLPHSISTSEIDTLASETCATLVRTNPLYEILATRIVLSNLQKIVPKTFSTAMEALHHANKLHLTFIDFVRKHAEQLNKMVEYERDYLIKDYSAAVLYFDKYTQRVGNVQVETPQYLYMRVAVAIECMKLENIPESQILENIHEAYDDMSKGLYTHATPTLFNAGMKKSQLSSCFLMQIEEDSIEGIYNTVGECARISKHAGGIGLAVHNVRCRNSQISSFGKPSDGIVPMLRVFNATARYVDQSKQRPGAFAIYLEPWHADIEEFLDLKKNTGSEEQRCRDLFQALWVPDLFMKCVDYDRDWYLMDPKECPLSELYGDDFVRMYSNYVEARKFVKKVKARTLWNAILDTQQETGGPYILYKDACNSKSNQNNLGTITSSNLCAEIVQYTNPNEIAVCNLASVALSKFVKDDGFDFVEFYKICRKVTRRLDKVIDINYYPLQKAEDSNLRHRPIGVGVQGLQNVFFKLKLPFTSDAAKQLNREIFATMYYACLTESVELAKQYGYYKTFIGSPAYNGQLQFDMWQVKPLENVKGIYLDWASLKQDIARYGLRNSLLIALMPTASTSVLLGNVESFEPQSYNMYVKRLSSGEFIILNKDLYKDLKDLGIWSEELLVEIMQNYGSVQNIAAIPQHLKDIYKTVWEIKVKDLIDMARDRGAYICQSQSFNVHFKQPTRQLLTSMHFYAWRQGLKTGMYYLRREAVRETVQFSIEPKVCTMKEGCLSCGS